MSFSREDGVDEAFRASPACRTGVFIFWMTPRSRIMPGQPGLQVKVGALVQHHGAEELVDLRLALRQGRDLQARLWELIGIGVA